jgi:hypothetical protein
MPSSASISISASPEIARFGGMVMTSAGCLGWALSTSAGEGQVAQESNYAKRT